MRQKCFLNGRPVFVGTMLQYLEEGESDLGPVEVIDMDYDTITYSSSAVDGTIRQDNMTSVFKHHDVIEPPENEFEIGTIGDMLELSPEQLDRFLKSLPLALASIRATQTAQRLQFEERYSCKLKGQDLKLFKDKTLPSIRWTDDDKDEVDVRINGDLAMSVKHTKQQS